MQHPNTATDSYLGFDIGGSTLTLPEVSQISSWTLPHQVHNFSSTHEPDPFSPSLTSSRWPYGLQFGYELGGPTQDHHQLSQLISESLGQVVHPNGLGPFGLQPELHKLTAQEAMDAKALAASRSHSEAERRRRERINNHLARLRSLLPTITKTDKASLLGEVIQHVKELKRQTSLIAEADPVPAETDELTVDDASDGDGQRLVRASICCEDRPNLLPDLINSLKALGLKTLRAEITTLGGRVKNVLFIAGEEGDSGPFGGGNFFGGGGGEGEEWERVDQLHCMSSIREALRAVMERSGGDHGGVKRQRTSGGGGGGGEYRSF